jgi:DNA replication and repair protein RecF
MYIQKIKLENFRNYEKAEIEFDKNVNIIYGDNAQGKTNILESIFVCSLGKSFRTNKDKELINKDKDFSKIEMISQKEDRNINIKFEMKEKKKFYINDIPVKKTSEIIGKTYIVLFTPEDIGIINNEPSKRRRFLNIMISQLRPVYINLLSEYNKVLEQRNIYLKQIKYDGKSIENLYIWDEQIAKLGQKIYEYRKEFIEKLNKRIYNIHLNITENKEEIKVEYISNIRKKLFRKFEKKSKK